MTEEMEKQEWDGNNGHQGAQSGKNGYVRTRMACLTFLQMVNGSFSGEEAATREALERYCELDTWGMVRILGKLREVAG